MSPPSARGPGGQSAHTVHPSPPADWGDTVFAGPLYPEESQMQLCRVEQELPPTDAEVGSPPLTSTFQRGGPGPSLIEVFLGHSVDKSSVYLSKVFIILYTERSKIDVMLYVKNRRERIKYLHTHLNTQVF